MKIWFSVAVASAVFFALIVPAEAKSYRDKDSYWSGDPFHSDDFPEKADANRDGYLNWMEYRDSVRDGSRRDFYRRDLDRDDRLSRDEWKRDDRDDRGHGRR
jgi:hypothetical protein